MVFNVFLLTYNRCVTKLESHISRSISSKASFSPDSVYVSVGSEDRSVRAKLINIKFIEF